MCERLRRHGRGGERDVPLLDDNPVPGTSGLPSLRKLIGTGHTVLTF